MSLQPVSCSVLGIRVGTAPQIPLGPHQQLPVPAEPWCPPKPMSCQMLGIRVGTAQWISPRPHQQLPVPGRTLVSPQIHVLPGTRVGTVPWIPPGPRQQLRVSPTPCSAQCRGSGWALPHGFPHQQLLVLAEPWCCPRPLSCPTLGVRAGTAPWISPEPHQQLQVYPQPRVTQS